MANTKEILSALAHAIELAQDELDQQETVRQRVATEVESQTNRNNSVLAEPKRKFRTFHSDEFGDLPTTIIDGKPYFRGDVIASAVGYRAPRNAVLTNCKGRKKIRMEKSGQKYYVQFIPEEDVRKLISLRKIELVHGFEEWFDNEIIPEFSRPQPASKEIDPDPGVKFYTLKHIEYGKVQLAVLDGEVYYRVIDVGTMLGYVNAKQCSTHMVRKIKLTAPNPIAPAQFLRSTFVKIDEVQGLFVRKKLMTIPVCVKMYNWLASLESEFVHTTKDEKIS